MSGGNKVPSLIAARDLMCVCIYFMTDKSFLVVASVKRHPRCSPVASSHVERRFIQDEKPVWAEGLERTWEVCILPEPAQAVVQTRRLNGAWSWQLFLTDAVRWVLLPPLSFSVTGVPAKQLPRSVLSFINAHTISKSIRESFSHHLHIQ